jgi:hypothetical protein
MSINYRLNGTEEESTAQFEAFTNEQREYYHQTLPLLMLGAGMDELTEENLQVFINRITVGEFIRVENMDSLFNFFRPFIGFSTNITRETTKTWLKRLAYSRLDLWGNPTIDQLYRAILKVPRDMLL